MAEPVLQLVSIRRRLIEGVEVRKELHEAVSKYAMASFYRRTPETLERLRRDMIRLLARKWLPHARAIGRASAQPILDVLEGAQITARPTPQRTAALRRLQTYSNRNLLAFRAELKTELRTLSGEVEAAFARGMRDGRARKALVDELVKIDKDELASLAKARGRQERAARSLGRAEGQLSKAATKPARAKARGAVKQARAELRKAKASERTVKSFYARFETRVQRHARDAIRREAEHAQWETFKGEGWGAKGWTWIAVNGGDACPSCEVRHGDTRSEEEWAGDKPGEGGTYCGDSCMCALIPADYHEQRELPPAPLQARRVA